MPMAISLFAAGVIWRLMYEKDPDQGTVNAAIAVVKDAVSPSGVLSAAQPSTDALEGGPAGGLVLKTPLEPGSVAQLGLTGIRSSDVPSDAEQAVGAGGPVGRDHRRRVERLQAGRRHRRRARGGGARVAGRHRRAPRRQRRERPGDRRPKRTARSRSRRSKPARIARQSDRTRSRSRSPACPGSAPA